MRYLWISAACAALLCICSAAAAPAERPSEPPSGASLPQPDALRVAKNSNGQELPVRPIDDPANPYAGRYGALDRWLWDHYTPRVTEMENLHSREEWEALQASYPADWQFMRANVDPEGWLIPSLEHPGYGPQDAKTIREYLDQLRTMNVEWGKPSASREERWRKAFYFNAVGHLGDGADKIMLESRNIDPAQMPIIPAWLGQNPPLLTVFVPNGEIAAYGPLGLHIEVDKDNHMYVPTPVEGEYWFRYSSDGKLLGQIRSSDQPYMQQNAWQDLYANWEAFEDDLYARGLAPFTTHNLNGGRRAYELGQYVASEQMPNSFNFQPLGQLLGAYDYMGNPVDPDATVNLRNSPLANALDADTVARLYRLQVQEGRTDPSVGSPFAGTAQGPQVVDATPRPPRRIAKRETPRANATRSMHAPPHYEIVDLRPLDDPANPYRESYGPWDKWVLDNYHKNNPRSTEFFQKQSAAITEEMSKAAKEGRKPDPKIIARGGYAQPASDPWMHFEVQVDPQGFQVPLVQQLLANASRQGADAGRDLRLPYAYSQAEPRFKYYAGGVMPEDMAAALEGELRKQLPDLARPQVPDWLAASPPYGVIFMPNGEVVTEGPLGSWHEGWQNEPRESRTDRGWYRYSASGELLGQVPLGAVGWVGLYNPLAASLEMSGKAQGYEVETEGGYLIWRNPREKGGTAITAWDITGNPVPLDKPLTLPAGAYRFYWWEDLQRPALNSLLHGY